MRALPGVIELSSMFTNKTIRIAVNDWCAGGDAKKRVESLYGDISNWDVAGVTDMSGLFQNKTRFNDDISKWNTSKVTNMSCMFDGASMFNQRIDTSGNQWNVSKVTDMSDMFSRGF